jgi:hypothetical protein
MKEALQKCPPGDRWSNHAGVPTVVVRHPGIFTKGRRS